MNWSSPLIMNFTNYELGEEGDYKYVNSPVIKALSVLLYELMPAFLA